MYVMAFYSFSSINYFLGNLVVTVIERTCKKNMKKMLKKVKKYRQSVALNLSWIFFIIFSIFNKRFEFYFVKSFSFIKPFQKMSERYYKILKQKITFKGHWILLIPFITFVLNIYVDALSFTIKNSINSCKNKSI